MRALRGHGMQAANRTSPGPARTRSPLAQGHNANGMQPMSQKDFQLMVDTTKKAIRDIRAADSQLRWDMLREDKHDKMSTERQVLDEIRDWRRDQSEGIKMLTAEKERQAKLIDLGESKAYQEFKRACKLDAQEDERMYQHEAYLQDLENASWRADLVLVARENEKEVLVDRHENVMEARIIKSNLDMQEKQDEAANRSLEQQLEMAKLIKDLQQERLQATENLVFTRTCCKNPRHPRVQH